MLRFPLAAAVRALTFKQLHYAMEASRLTRPPPTCLWLPLPICWCCSPR